MLKSAIRFIFQKLYNVKIEGLENLKKAGDRALIVANHLSFLDAALPKISNQLIVIKSEENFF